MFLYEETGFTDLLHRPIFLHSFLKNGQGSTYKVRYDTTLGYIIIDIEKNTVEQLTEFNSIGLSLI
jgi:hypothetical protein